jgi:hypothetical protein
MPTLAQIIWISGPNANLYAMAALVIEPPSSGASVSTVFTITHLQTSPIPLNENRCGSSKIRLC